MSDGSNSGLATPLRVWGLNEEVVDVDEEAGWEDKADERTSELVR